ncbi:MAG TPA: sugar transferase [Bacilli bacterium]
MIPYAFAKRAIDITGALSGLILLSPLIILLAIAIKLEAPKAPVFFSQMRVGKNGKLFRMYKFRSMVPNAENLLPGLMAQNEIKGHMFKIKDDPRISKVGKIIRKTSLDELPQLWNVLKGEMSLVGPRPPLPNEVKEYSPFHFKRLSVIPGCTGLWQISGRNKLNFEQMVELDLQYIANRSIGLDVKIILKTFRVMLGSDDAY